MNTSRGLFYLMLGLAGHSAACFGGLAGDDGGCGGPATAIPEVQGDAAASPLHGEVIEVEGVVAGDFQGRDALGGFFLQSLRADANPATSEGLFVFAPGGVDVAVGDVVRVTGRVKEFDGLTELVEARSLTICRSGAEVSRVELDADALRGGLERFEGMAVTVPGELTVVGSRELGRYGQVELAMGEATAADGRPGPRLLLDDGSRRRKPKPVPYLGDEPTLRLGDRLSEIRGLVAELPEGHVIHPDEAPRRITRNPRPERPPDVGGELKVAAFNVHNYFLSLGERGAGTADHLERQREKLVAALAELDADIVALSELESRGGSARDLATRLNGHLGERAYAATPDPRAGLGNDVIKVGLIYRLDAVRPRGPSRTDAHPIFIRRPLAQVFEAGRLSLAVVTAHLKSKRCDDDAVGDDADRGRGCWSGLRTRQAERLARLASSLAAGLDAPRGALILGDLNAYGDEAPIAALRTAGFVDLMAAEVPAAERYSFNYRGQRGYLDHALASTELARRVTGAGFWHINADEPPAFDYAGREDLYAPDPYRSSDHDPLLVGFE